MDFSINLQSLNESVDTTNDWNSNLNSASSLPWADDVCNRPYILNSGFTSFFHKSIDYSRSWRIMPHWGCSSVSMTWRTFWPQDIRTSCNQSVLIQLKLNSGTKWSSNSSKNRNKHQSFTGHSLTCLWIRLGELLQETREQIDEKKLTKSLNSKKELEIQGQRCALNYG